jgi:H+/Cl- antiporter ClcA
MSITFPEGVIVRNTGTVILSAYIAVIMAALLLGPLIVLHGYRQWWLVVFYAGAVIGSIGGGLSHYRMVLRNRRS